MARFQYTVRDNPSRIVTHVFNELSTPTNCNYGNHFEEHKQVNLNTQQTLQDIAHQLTLISSQSGLTSKALNENEKSRDSIINPHQLFNKLPTAIGTEIINYSIHDTKEDEFQNDAAMMEGNIIELSLDDSVEEEDATNLEEESDNEILVRKLQELEGFEIVFGHAWMTALGTKNVEFAKYVFGFKLDEVKHQWQGEIDASSQMVQYHLWLNIETSGDDVISDVELQGFLDHFNEIIIKSKGLLFMQKTNYSFLFDPGGKIINMDTKLRVQFKVNSSTTTIKFFKNLCSALPTNWVLTYMNEVFEVDDPFIFRLLVMGCNSVVMTNNKDFTELGIVMERSVKSRDVEVNRIMSMYGLAKYLVDVAFILVVLSGKSDLGTTYFGVSVWQHDWVEILADDQGNRTTTSYVEIKDTKGLISDAAENQIAMILFNIIFNAKKLIGRIYSDVFVQSEVKLWLVKVDIDVNEHEEVAQKLLEDFNGVIAFLSIIYQTLPIRDEILRGLQHWNLNGFLAFDYAQQFLSCRIRMLNVEPWL
ncbi:hypothetical protein GQ457_09G011790 [Hibiscus cannabinus]